MTTAFVRVSEASCKCSSGMQAAPSLISNALNSVLSKPLSSQHRPACNCSSSFQVSNSPLLLGSNGPRECDLTLGHFHPVHVPIIYCTQTHHARNGYHSGYRTKIPNAPHQLFNTRPISGKSSCNLFELMCFCSAALDCQKTQQRTHLRWWQLKLSLM